ncbi:MAG: glutamine synthetase [Firmicutes bacterium]|nr:glutamine synthetase [Bacillota bacterium]
MIYTEKEILQYIEENDVKFIKLTFCDLYGRLKNISILSSELEGIFEKGVRIASEKIAGFDIAKGRDIFLFPDPRTMTVLPWRPQQGRVIRMYCFIRYADGTHFEGDSRYFLKKAMKAAISAGYCFRFGTSCEFTLFTLSERGLPTKTPHDYAGYCDTAPDDKGENIRRDVCLTLEQMGIRPISSRHESGWGQHEIDFNTASALKAADTFLSFKSAVRSVADTHGVYASFMPKPLREGSGNAMNISFNIYPDTDFLEEKEEECKEITRYGAAGVLKYIQDFTLFTNSTVNSYLRLGRYGAPSNVSWSDKEGYELVRLSSGEDGFLVTLKISDCVCNPYIVFGLIIYASLEAIADKEPLPEKENSLSALAKNISEAAQTAQISEFLKNYIPSEILNKTLEEANEQWREYSVARDKEDFMEKKYFYIF